MSGGVQTVELPSGQTIYYREAQHAYYLGFDEAKGKCSQRIPGFSTVGKCVDTRPDGLMGWAAKLEAQGVCELVEALPDYGDLESLIANGGDDLHRELAKAGLDWRSVRDRRAKEGTAVHEKVFAALGRGKRPSLADVTQEERAYGQAVFKAWRDFAPEPIAVEQIVYSPTFQTAGRIDLLATVDGVVELWDAKTAAAPENGRERFINLGHHAQLAGYSYAVPESGFPVPERARLLYLMDDGSYEFEECAAGHEDFEAALATYNAAKRIGKAARAGRKKAQQELVPV